MRFASGAIRRLEDRGVAGFQFRDIRTITQRIGEDQSSQIGRKGRAGSCDQSQERNRTPDSNPVPAPFPAGQGIDLMDEAGEESNASLRFFNPVSGSADSLDKLSRFVIINLSA